MKKQPTVTIRVLTVTALIFVFSFNSFAQSKNIQSVQDYTSIAQISGTGVGKNLTYTNPYNNHSATNFAGVLNGTLNSHSEKFYCIDLQHYLATNQDYWDEASTSSEITYILNNYYPYKTNYSGKLSDLEKEAAAIQFAIWHFSDGANANSISGEYTIRNRTLAIIADANANHNNAAPLQTLIIVPVSQSFVQGTAASFDVYALDLNGDPISNLSVQLTTTLGTLSVANGTTDASGHVGPVTLTYNGTGTATIKAKTNVEIPQGTRYVHKSHPTDKQKLVLATPSYDMKEVTATVEWYSPPVNCDTHGYVTFTQGGWGSPSNSAPGVIRDTHFSSVFPSGLVIGSTKKLTLTTASAVKNFLPAGGTAGVFTQNYTDASSTSAGVLAGQLVALKMNVAYDAAGFIGTNSNDLGSLVIFGGPFDGYSVNQFLALAEQAIGGGSLNSFTFSQINDAATAINENFDNGTVDNGNLICSVPVCKNKIGDYVWHDKNVDGKQDPNEPGIPGVIVELLQNNNVIATDTTDLNGKYEFNNLDNGTYSVRVASSNTNVGRALYSNTQKKWYATKKNQGSDDSKDSDAGINETVNVTLSCGDDITIDFGFYFTCISVSKTTDKQSAAPGDTVTYLFRVENCGDVQFHGGVDVYDNMLGWTNNNPYHINILNPGESNSFEQEYIVTSNDCGQLTNTVRADGHPVDTNLPTVSDEASASVEINCGLSCVTDWSVTLGPDSAICQYDPTNITIHGSVHLTPNPSKAYLQLSWRIVEPNDGSYDNSTHYQTILITQDTTFSITAQWPGVRSTDSLVEIHYGVNVLDCEHNPIKNGVGRDLYWYPWVCNPPQEQPADVKIEKFSSTENPQCGEQFTYTVKVTNDGPNEAKGIQATDVLPAGLTYVSNNASQGSYDYNTGLWTVGDLANNAFATLEITVTADCDSLNNSTFDFGAAKDYNLFVILDATQPSSDTQGKVAVGRNASFGNYSIGDQLPMASGDVLIVGNDLTFTSGAVYNGSVVYGDTTNLPIYAVSISNGTVRQDNPINFAAAKVYLENLSTTLNGYTVNGTTTFQWGGLTLSGTDPYLNVFSVSGSDLSSANNFAIDVPNGSVVLVNIDGTNVSWTGGLTVSGTAINNVLYNFPQASQLRIQGIDVRGSILAPFADVNFVSGVQNGQMMCKSLVGMGQFNYAPFKGNIPVEKHITNIATITNTVSPDPNTNNNSASVEVLVSNTTNTNSGNNGGSNNGNWQEVSGFGAGEIVYTMAYDGNTIYAGTWGGKIYKSVNNGQSWSVINQGMNVGFIWSLQVVDNNIFAATELGVYKYDGSSWTLTTLTGTDVHALATYNGTIYAGTWGLGVFKSVDNGATWTEINNGLGYVLVVQSLVVNSNGDIFVGTAGDGLYKSTDGGANFTKLSFGYSLIWALGITSNNTLFVGSYGDGLYRSTDNGATFTKVSSLNVPYIYSIVVDASNKAYVASWASGVYTSEDNGSTWSSMGMGGLGVSSLMVSSGSNNVFVGTKEGKVFVKMAEGVTAVNNDNEIPTTFELNQNFPNPFNPTTTIRFAIPETGNYSLRIYDILGQEVATLVNGQLNIGIHNVNFDASRLASGMYIYKLTGDKVNLTKKMLLVK